VELPADDENAVREYLCINAYLVNMIFSHASLTFIISYVYSM